MVEVRASRAAVATLMCAVLLVSSAPAVQTFPYDPHEHCTLRLIDSWRDPGGLGSDLVFVLNVEGNRLLLVGYGAPGEVRVTDLDLGNAIVMEPPSPGFFARGADWTRSEENVVVWGDALGGEPLALFDVSTGRLDETAAWLDLVDLVEVTEVSFFAGDSIATVAGRDENGTSHLLFIETRQKAIRWDYEWEGNHTILVVEDNSRELVVADSGGTITVIQGQDWNEFRTFPGVLHGGAASWHVPIDHQWGFGDAEGRVVMSHDHPFYPQFNITVGDGPVTGFAWTLGRLWDFVMALRLPGGGSRMEAWEMLPEGDHREGSSCLFSLEISGNVTMMTPDPRGWSRVLVAMGDGTIASYKMDVRSRPIYMPPDDPDVTDGLGLEPFIEWHPGGETDALLMRYEFNHQGSLIALRGFGDREDLRVIDRTFETVAELKVPWEPEEHSGMVWSDSDRWLVTWAHVPGGDQELRLRVFEAPTFTISTTFPDELVLNSVYTLWDMAFLPGDQVVAIACSNMTSDGVVMFLNLTSGELEREVVMPEGGAFLDLEWDGGDIVALLDQGGIWALSPPDWRYTRTGAGPDVHPMCFDVNATSGWCILEDRWNFSIWNGSSREEALHWCTDPASIFDVSWTNGMVGDFVLANPRIEGSAIQLWRPGAGTAGDWRSVGGARMMTQLNSSRKVVQMEADPAYPGLMAVSFEDGTLSLYHLNITPYPPPPEELGDLDIGPIYPLPNDQNGTGDGGDGDDGRYWVFPVAFMASIIVVLAVVMLWVRIKVRRKKD